MSKQSELLALLKSAAQDDDPVPALINAAQSVANTLQDERVKRAFRKVIRNARATLD